MANKPFSEKLQREADWHLQQAQLARLKGNAGKSLKGIAQALRGGGVASMEEEGTVTKAKESKSNTAAVVGSSAALLVAPHIEREGGAGKLMTHACGPHTRAKKYRHGIPSADPALLKATVTEHQRTKKRPFAFIERTWEIELPPEDARVLTPDEMLPEQLKEAMAAAVDESGQTVNEVMNIDLKAINIQKDPARRRAIGKNKKRAVQMKRRKRIKKCQPY